MEDKKKIVKSLEKMLDMLPDNLTKEEKDKVADIKEMLNKIDKKVDKEERKDSLER